MIAEGRRTSNFVAERIEKLEPLKSSLVERGEVYKEPLYSDFKNEIALLWVSPMGKIKNHSHYEDSEEYTDLDNNTSEFCIKGRHFLENKSKTCWLVVLARKYK